MEASFILGSTESACELAGLGRAELAHHYFNMMEKSVNEKDDAQHEFMKREVRMVQAIGFYVYGPGWNLAIVEERKRREGLL